jgi:methylated-DNA-[protein]-cysteine S-methyltransferase
MNNYTLSSIIIDHTSLGRIFVFADYHGLTALTFTTTPDAVASKPSETKLVSASQALSPLADQLLRYLAGEKLEFTLEVNWSIFSPFQREVLQRACLIANGRVMTYGQLATALGKPGGARAVGSALAANPIPILIPCHRVVGSDGSLHGYSAPGGSQTKAWLLALEGHKFTPGNPLKLTKESYGKPD